MRWRILLPEEEFRDVAGTGGNYAVSNMGRLWSRPRTNTAGGILKRNQGSFYPQHTLVYADGKLRTVPVHRLVMAAFVGDRPHGMVARHIDGDPNNNCVQNLEWCTQAENIADKHVHGTAVVGEQHHNARLRAADVAAIREAYESGVKQTDLARRYNISQAVVSKVVRREAWKHI